MGVTQSAFSTVDLLQMELLLNGSSFSVLQNSGRGFQFQATTVCNIKRLVRAHSTVQLLASNQQLT